jgi:hypothetical protein
LPSLKSGSVKNSVSKRYSVPNRARAAAAVNNFTFEAGFSSSSASRENTTEPSSRLRTCTVTRAVFSGDRSMTDCIACLSASRSACCGGPAST